VSATCGGHGGSRLCVCGEHGAAGSSRLLPVRAARWSFPQDFLGSLMLADFTLLSPPATTPEINLLDFSGTTSTVLFDGNTDPLTALAGATNAASDAVDGLVTVSTISRNLLKPPTWTPTATSRPSTCCF